MSVRRLLAASVALSWLTPTLVVGAIALHLAFEHQDEKDHGAILGVAVHGHVHSAADLPHEHSTFLTGAAASLRSLESKSIGVIAVSTAAWVVPDARFFEGPAAWNRLAPPRVCGPPLLARLSTLRV